MDTPLPGTGDLGTRIIEHFPGPTAVCWLQLPRFVLGQLVLLACIAAGMTASCILFVLYGPVPVKRKVTIVPRHAPPDVFAAQPKIRPSQLTPAAATPIEQPLTFRPRGESPPPLPRSRSARGTGPRDRHLSEEDIRTQPTPRVDLDTGAFLVDGR